MAEHIDHALAAAEDLGFSEITYGAVWLLSVIGKNYVYDVDILDYHRTRAKALIRQRSEAFVEQLNEPYNEAVRAELQEIYVRLDAEGTNGAYDAFERLAGH